MTRLISKKTGFLLYRLCVLYNKSFCMAVWFWCLTWTSVNWDYGEYDLQLHYICLQWVVCQSTAVKWSFPVCCCMFVNVECIFIFSQTLTLYPSLHSLSSCWHCQCRITSNKWWRQLRYHHSTTPRSSITFSYSFCTHNISVAGGKAFITKREGGGEKRGRVIATVRHQSVSIPPPSSSSSQCRARQIQ